MFAHKHLEHIYIYSVCGGELMTTPYFCGFIVNNFIIFEDFVLPYNSILVAMHENFIPKTHDSTKNFTLEIIRLYIII